MNWLNWSFFVFNVFNEESYYIIHLTLRGCILYRSMPLSEKYNRFLFILYWQTKNIWYNKKFIKRYWQTPSCMVYSDHRLRLQLRKWWFHRQRIRIGHCSGTGIRTIELLYIIQLHADETDHQQGVLSFNHVV